MGGTGEGAAKDELFIFLRCFGGLCALEDELGGVDAGGGGVGAGREGARGGAGEGEAEHVVWLLVGRGGERWWRCYMLVVAAVRSGPEFGMGGGDYEVWPG